MVSIYFLLTAAVFQHIVLIKKHVNTDAGAVLCIRIRM